MIKTNKKTSSKKIILVSLLVVLLLIIGTGMYETVVGMVSVSETVQRTITYTCTDNDNFVNNPINTKGTVSIISSAGEREHYTDYCINESMAREYSCDPDTNRQTYLDHSCSHLGEVCVFGRCMKEW